MKKTAKKIFSVSMTLMLILTLAMSNPSRASASGQIETLLNTAPLNPAVTEFAPLNYLVSVVLSQITTPEMTTYQKVKACYDYLIDNCEYGIYDLKYFDWYYYNELYGYDGDEVAYLDLDAYAIIDGHVGVCDDYTSAFVVMTRALGLESYKVTGDTHMASGGYTPHAWAVIILNGTEYVFDPQIDDNIAKGGKTGYYRFGKTYAEVPDKYIWDGGRYVPSGMQVTYMASEATAPDM